MIQATSQGQDRETRLMEKDKRKAKKLMRERYLTKKDVGSQQHVQVDTLNIINHIYISRLPKSCMAGHYEV